jgi:hypothetical protein
MPTVASVHKAGKSSKLSQVMSSLKRMGLSSGKGGSSSKGAEAHDDDSLSAVLRAPLYLMLKPLKLDGDVNPLGSIKTTRSKLELAVSWCSQQGATSADDIFKLDEADQQGFVAALQLKPLKEKQLLQNLKQAKETRPPSVTNMTLNARL